MMVDEQRMEKGLFDAFKQSIASKRRDTQCRSPTGKRPVSFIRLFGRGSCPKMNDEANWSGLIAAAEEFNSLKEIANGDEASV